MKRSPLCFEKLVSQKSQQRWNTVFHCPQGNRCGTPSETTETSVHCGDCDYLFIQENRFFSKGSNSVSVNVTAARHQRRKLSIQHRETCFSLGSSNAVKIKKNPNNQTGEFKGKRKKKIENCKCFVWITVMGLWCPTAKYKICIGEITVEIIEKRVHARNTVRQTFRNAPS